VLQCGKNEPSGQRSMNHHAKPTERQKQKNHMRDTHSCIRAYTGTCRPRSVRFCCTGTTSHCTGEKRKTLDILPILILDPLFKKTFYQFGSYYLPRHSWPSPPIFVPIAIFCLALSHHSGFLFPCIVQESFVCLKVSFSTKIEIKSIQ
jgi:hypothetical protein